MWQNLAWKLLPEELLAHCPGAVATGWGRRPYQPTKAPALVGVASGATLEFRPGPGRLELFFHKHAWSGSVEITVGDRRERHDLHAPHPHPLAPVGIDVPGDQTVTIRCGPRLDDRSQGDEVWFAGAAWDDGPDWFPAPAPAPAPAAGTRPNGRHRTSHGSVRLEGRAVLRDYLCSDDPLNIFDGYAFFEGARAHCCRRWFGQGTGKIGDFQDSRIVVNGQDLDYGVDPRLFVHQGRLCVVSAAYSFTHGFRNHLMMREPSGQWSRHHLMPPLGLPPGKNWTPFEDHGGRLSFIHSFSPLVILRESRREGGAILLEASEAPGIPVEHGPEDFPAHRGGTNGVKFGGLVVGVGHTTRLAFDPGGAPVYHPHCYFPDSHQLVHRPFGWMLNPVSLAVATFDIEHEWDPTRWIVDPTSLVAHAGEACLELVTTEVERNFVDPTGGGQAVSYRVPFDALRDIAALHSFAT